jgi:hypothetical protein
MKTINHYIPGLPRLEKVLAAGFAVLATIEVMVGQAVGTQLQLDSSFNQFNRQSMAGEPIGTNIYTVFFQYQTNTTQATQTYLVQWGQFDPANSSGRFAPYFPAPLPSFTSVASTIFTTPSAPQPPSFASWTPVSQTSIPPFPNPLQIWG